MLVRSRPVRGRNLYGDADVSSFSRPSARLFECFPQRLTAAELSGSLAAQRCQCLAPRRPLWNEIGREPEQPGGEFKMICSIEVLSLTDLPGILIGAFGRGSQWGTSALASQPSAQDCASPAPECRCPAFLLSKLTRIYASPAMCLLVVIERYA